MPTQICFLWGASFVWRFNSLFEMPAGLSVDYEIAVKCFNSLFEMPAGGFPQLRRLSLRCFNSLFEMRNNSAVAGRGRCATIICVSILYLRCGSWVGAGVSHFTEVSILYLRCPHVVYAAYPRLVAPGFNSLFEMLHVYDVVSQIDGTTKSFQFSI